LTERSFTAHMERSVGIEALNIATKQRWARSTYWKPGPTWLGAKLWGTPVATISRCEHQALMKGQASKSLSWQRISEFPLVVLDVWICDDLGHPKKTHESETGGSISSSRKESVRNFLNFVSRVESRLGLDIG
jgi:hypothetical protein